LYTGSEKLLSANITDIMQTAYIDYSMSVIISRALPDARDGLKPVQRRILYAMLREGLVHNRPYDKCAGVVGEVLKNYHPHGDASVYDTLVRLAQTWVLRYPLIDPQGNFGSVDGDPPAAYRYTECRLNEAAEELLRDIEEETVDFAPNYKESTTEPVVLPAALPNLLMNGSTGIAVGMATNIPPHNLTEIIDAACAILENRSVSLDDICSIVKGPDFPTGGVISGREAILSYLHTGKGVVRIRGKAHSEELKGGAEQIVITEIPYNVNRANLVTRIAELVSEKALDGIRDLRDESDENTRIVVELKRGEQAKVVINQLFQKTALESSFGVTLLALDRNRPKQMNIKELIECYIEHRRDVVTRRTRFRLREAEDRAHILEGYIIALDNLDDFVKIIRGSANRDEAKARLMAKYPLSERQTDAILELRLYQLTGLERGKIEAEYLSLMKIIEELRAILENEAKLTALIKAELLEMRAKYASPRRTEIIAATGEFRMEDVIPNEGCVITVSHMGFIKRTRVADYRSQRRGGKGIIGTETYDEDFVEHLFTASTHDFILFLTNTGQCHAKKVYDIPEGTRASKGKSVSSFLRLAEGEKIAAMICVKDFVGTLHLVMATKGGVTKKTNLADYANATREGGLRGIKLEEGDAPGLRADERPERDRPRQPQGAGRALRRGRPARPGPRHRRRDGNEVQDRRRPREGDRGLQPAGPPPRGARGRDRQAHAIRGLPPDKPRRHGRHRHRPARGRLGQRGRRAQRARRRRGDAAHGQGPEHPYPGERDPGDRPGGQGCEACHPLGGRPASQHRPHRRDRGGDGIGRRVARAPGLAACRT
jgi:DNA gyrase subunit A